LQEIDTIKKVIRPTPPLIVLVHGNLSNRHGGGTNEALGVEKHVQTRLRDWKLKSELENIYFNLNLLKPSEYNDTLPSLATLKSIKHPPAHLVLLLEALLIIITPQKQFRGPAPAGELSF
jgi:hypothetical protein